MQIEGYGLQCKKTSADAAWEDVTLASPLDTKAAVGGLGAYALAICRVRAKASGVWGDWSAASADMRSSGVCGNGVREGSEMCDQGNTDPDDGCSATCTVEAQWSCVTRVGLPDACSPGCGNSIREGDEQCDLGTGVLGEET